LNACNEASARFRTMMSDESQSKAAEKGKEIANPTSSETTRLTESATRSSTEQPPAPSAPIDYKKLGREQRMREMGKVAGLKAAAAAAPSVGSAAVARPSQQSNPSWGGRSAWSFPAQSERGSNSSDILPAQPDEGSMTNGIADSIYAWTASSMRARYHIWGNAAGSAPLQEPNFRNGSVASAHPASNDLSAVE
jgi:hypothetical protein